MKQVLFSPPAYGRGNEGPERLSDLPKVTEQGCGHAGVRAQAARAPAFFPHLQEPQAAVNHVMELEPMGSNRGHADHLANVVSLG